MGSNMFSASTARHLALALIGAAAACADNSAEPVATALPLSAWHASAIGSALGYTDVFLVIGQAHSGDQATAQLRFISADTMLRPDLLVNFNVVLGRQRGLTFLIDAQRGAADTTIQGVAGCGSVLAPMSANHTCHLRGTISFDGALTDRTTLAGDLFANNISAADTIVHFTQGFGGPLSLKRCSDAC